MLPSETGWEQSEIPPSSREKHNIKTLKLKVSMMKVLDLQTE